MSEDKLKLYKINFGLIQNEYFYMYAFAYTKDELLGRLYNFGYRNLPLVSSTVKDKYLVKVNSSISEFGQYDVCQKHVRDLDFDPVCELYNRLQKDNNNKLRIPSNKLLLCIELLEVIMINWNE